MFNSKNLWAVCCLLGTVGSVVAAPPMSKAPDFLPASTVVYIEGIGSQKLLELPLVQAIKGTPLYRQLWRSPDAMKLRGGITLVEVVLGEPVTDALARATQGGWVLAVDAHTQGVVLLAESPDKETCRQLYGKLESLAADDAKRNQRPFEKTNYRDAVAYQFNGVVIASLDKWLMLTNKGELGKLLADNLAAQASNTQASNTQASNMPETLSAQASFREARLQQEPSAESDGSQSLLWAWSDLQQLRQRGVARKLFMPPEDNFAAELLVGGVLAVLRHSPTVTAELMANPDQLQLAFHAPTPTNVVTDSHPYFFGPNGTGGAPMPLKITGPHATLSAYRDLADLWRRAGDLFGQKVNDQLAQAETTLTTLFSGREFGEEILGAIEPGVQLVVAQQPELAAGAPVPQTKLPAFGLVAQLREADQMRPQLKRIFMSLIGFLNIVGAMDQQPQLDMELVQRDNLMMVTSTYVVDRDRPKDWVTPIQFNFTPTLAMLDRHVVLASSRELAEQIAGQWRDETDRSAVSTSNTLLHVDGRLVTSSLSANRNQLISQNMLEKGHTPEEAAEEVDLFLRLLALVQSFDVRLDTHPQTSLVVQLTVQLR